MQEACYLFGNHSTQTNNSIRLLHLISCHPSFRNKVNNFLQLFPSLTKDNLVHLGILTMTLMLPNYPAQYHKKIALELFDSLIGYSKVPTLTTLSQYLLKLCSYCVISLDVHSAIGFLSLVESRITNCYVISAVSADCRKQVGFQSNLSFIQPEIIIEESGLPESSHRQASQHLYYEEKISFIQNQLKIQADSVLLRELKSNAKQVIPLGYICEHYLHDLINNNFQNKNSYRLQPSKRTVLNMKVDYWVTPNQKVIDNLRDEIVNLQTFRSCAVLTHSHIPQKIDPNPIKSYPIALINSTFSHPIYFEKLKHLERNQLKYFNILSDYYERDEFNIDELTLTREKLISRRKQHLLGMNTKQTIRKEDKDYQEQVLKLGLNISRQQNLKEDAKRTNATVQQLSGLLREQLQQDKNINKYLEKYLSEQSSIRTDPQHTFSSDIIQQASIIPLQLMLIGRPKSGKSTLSKLIAQHYKLVYISIESMVDKIFERMKYFEQNPPQPDEDGNIKQGLLAIQKCIIEDIAQGKCSDNEDILDLINNQLTKPFTKSRGFILDLPFEYDRFWIDNLISNRIEMPKIGCRFITHMIVIEQTQDQWKYFTSSLMQKPQQLTISSNLDRYLMVKPKTINNEEEGDLQGEQEEEEKIQPLNQKNLIKLKCKDSYYTLMEHMSQHMHHNRIIKIKNAFQSPSQCLQTLKYYLYSIPIAKKIEGSEKELLTVGLEEIQMIRKWSPWGIIDCLQLHRNKLIAGKSQFAAEYAGRVFIFNSEQNLTQFIDNPRPYLSKLPCIPDKTNICITGPRKSGKKTIAKLLSSIYGWKVIDFQSIIQTVIKRQKSFEMPVPSNPAKRSKSVHLSQPEFKQFTKGNLLNSKDVFPIILYWLGVVLQKKPIGWGLEKDEQGGVNTGEEQKKPVPKKGKKKEKIVEDERPKTPPLQDLNLKDIIPEINHFGKLDEIKGYILIGYPNNEQQLAAMKNFNIPIDKMILLNDNNEQNPNKILQTRLNDAELEQVSGFMTMIGGVKDALGEQICKEVSINNTPEEIINKIRQTIDPFYLKCDDDSLNRVCADKQEQGDPIAMGYCSDYCPVVLQEGWLIKGKDQFQAGVEGKRFKFLTEKQQNEFKQNPKKYLEFNKNIPPPRIMFMGVRGVGLTTQLLKLNQKYKIPILNLKDTLLQKLENQTNIRKMQRYYKKGFKKPQVDEQGNVVEDTELNEQSPDFDKKNEEIKLIHRIFQGIEQIFINGNFYDVEQEKVSTGIVQLLAEAKRLPQLVITLTCQESQWLQRVMNKKEIEQQLQRIKTKRKMEKQKEREEAKEQAKKKAEEDGEQYQQPAQIEEEEDDPEIPKLEDMITQKEQELKTRREADNTRMEELTETFKTYNVEVVSLSCERQAKHVTDRINHVIKPIIEDRLNKLSRSSMLSIQRQRVPHFLDNYCALDSRFGKANPFTFMINPLPYPLLYNDRIYYLKDEEERQSVLRNPQSLKLNQAVPHDVYISPIIFVIGHTKTGKSTLAQNISKKMGLILIDLKQIGEMWTTEHSNLEVNDIKTVIKDGKVLSDEAIITLIRKRASMKDCLSRGWILDGFPNNTNQCQLLNKSGIEPLVVFQLKMTELQIKQRVIKSNLVEQHYDFDMQVIHDRIKNYKKSLFEVQSYYWNRFNNIQNLNAKLSKWGLVELVTKQIQKRYKYKKNMILNLAIHNAMDLSTIRLNFNCILNNLSEYQNYCPVSYKIRRQFINLCIKHHQHLSLYNKKIYIFKTQKELKDFLNNPDTFIKLNHPLNAPKQVQLKEISKAIMKVQNEEYCMVELRNNKLIKGNSLWCIQQNNKYYLTSTAIRMKQYLMNPSYYQLAKLPDKLPVQFQKKNDLKKIARRNDCAAFLEHHLSVIMMKSLAQLGYRRPKYPTLGSKQSALKFLAISLKANNPNKDQEYRRKYTEKLTKFIKQCSYSQQIRDQLNRKQKKTWQNYDEQNLLKLSQEYSSFLKVLQNQDKMKYFSDFIR